MLWCVILLVIVAIAMVRERRARRAGEREEPEAIWIEDSPLPTRSQAKVPMESPPTRRTARRAARAGAARQRRHAKKKTMWYTPDTHTDCGYMCVIKAAGKRPTKRRVRALRKQVAARLAAAEEKDEHVGGLRVREVICNENMTVDMYLSKTKRTMWASRMEIAAAAEEENIALCMKGYEGTLGACAETPKYYLEIRHNHYIAYRLKDKEPLQAAPRQHERRKAQEVETAKKKRAGMRPADRAGHIFRPTQEAFYVLIDCSEITLTPATRLIVKVPSNATVEMVKDEIEKVTKEKASNIDLRQVGEDQDLPDWVEAQDYMIASKKHTGRGEVEFVLTETTSIRLMIEESDTIATVKKRLAETTRIAAPFMRLKRERERRGSVKPTANERRKDQNRGQSAERRNEEEYHTYSALCRARRRGR